MRIISQDKKSDINYENWDLSISEIRAGYFEIITSWQPPYMQNEMSQTIATYSTLERALDVMSQLRLAWLSESIHGKCYPTPSSPTHNIRQNKIYYMPEE